MKFCWKWWTQSLKDLRLWIWTGLIDLKVGGGWWWVGGPSNFIVNQSPNPWILGFEILDLDFGLDNNIQFKIVFVHTLSEHPVKPIQNTSSISSFRNFNLLTRTVVIHNFCNVERHYICRLCKSDLLTILSSWLFFNIGFTKATLCIPLT